jgi:hypothetical protein
LEMFTNYFLGHVSTKALRGALVVALGATLAALVAIALVVAASGTAVGQQQAQESSAEPWGAPQPEQSTQSDFAPAERVVGLNEGVTNTTQGLEQAAQASGGRVVDRLDDPKTSDVQRTRSTGPPDGAAVGRGNRLSFVRRCRPRPWRPVVSAARPTSWLGGVRARRSP